MAAPVGMMALATSMKYEVQVEDTFQISNPFLVGFRDACPNTHTPLLGR